MSDDFLRLVSQANPATRQYQPANNGYPPTNMPYSDQASPQLMDPFFDDDDDVSDTNFGRPGPMQSVDSGLPLARSAVPPAGSGPSKLSLGDGVPQGWNFDDDDLRPENAQFPGSSSFNGTPTTSSNRASKSSTKGKWTWKWPWQKEKVLTGERIIALNNSAANSDFASNFVSTSKYNLVTFVPKFLLGTTLSVFDISLLLIHKVPRTILQIRQLVLLVHGMYPANIGYLSYKQVHHDRSVGRGTLCLCL